MGFLKQLSKIRSLTRVLCDMFCTYKFLLWKYLSSTLRYTLYLDLIVTPPLQSEFLRIPSSDLDLSYCWVFQYICDTFLILIERLCIAATFLYCVVFTGDSYVCKWHVFSFKKLFVRFSRCEFASSKSRYLLPFICPFQYILICFWFFGMNLFLKLRVLF